MSPALPSRGADTSPGTAIAAPSTIRQASTALFELNAAAEHAKAAARKRDRRAGIEIWRGSSVVRINGKAPGPWVINWREKAGGPRLQTMRAKFAKAKKFAEQKAIDLANGEIAMLNFGPQDRASFLRVMEILLPTSMPAELAAAEYAEHYFLLRETGLTKAEAQEAIRGAAAKKKIIPRLPKDIIDEFMAAKRANTFGKRHSGGKWHRTLEGQLKPFGEYFGKPLNSVTAAEMETWLNGLKVKSDRTRKGYRTAISGLVSYAKHKGYVPEDWKEFAKVPVPKTGRIKKPKCSPDELARMLRLTPGKMIPFMTLQPFAGVRHEELNPEDKKKTPLDWSEFNFETGIVHIPPETAKTGEQGERYIQMPPNLIAWLMPYRRPSGPVCIVANTSNALDRIKKKAGIRSGKNETRNFLRKSWETYSSALKAAEDVAGEGGHSQAVSKKHYVAATWEGPAKEWFNIFPTTSDILQLDFGLRVAPKSVIKL